MNRRNFLRSAGGLILGLGAQGCSMALPGSQRTRGDNPRRTTVTLFLGGDVMTGRGIDQILPHPSNPKLYERYVRDARDYVKLAENANGPIAKPVDFDYIWGDALRVLERKHPDLRIINLETSITTSGDRSRDKGIHYRMHPENTPVLTAAAIDCCALANNHTLDWGRAGLLETIDVLETAGIGTCGAGRNREEAQRPLVLQVGSKARVLVYSMAEFYSGIPDGWNAQRNRPGINAPTMMTRNTIERMAARIKADKQPGDLVILSIHWGGNWGYEVQEDHRELAQKMIGAGVDVIHGHSSHHAMGVEVIDNRPVLYGCGDLINDYEGIRDANQRYRGNLPLMYFVTMEIASGELSGLEMVPLSIRNFQLNRASAEETQWLGQMLNREGAKLNTSVELNREGAFELSWRNPTD